MKKFNAKIAAFGCFSMLLIAVLSPTAAHCWGAEGHQLIAGIAKTRMSAEAVEKVEGLLRAWDNIHGGGATMEEAAVWLDNIAEPASMTHWNFHEDIQVLKEFHYCATIFNPQSITIEGAKQFQPLEKTTNKWFLSNTYKSLLETSHGDKPVDPKIGKVGTLFSLNFHLRAFLHLYGDLHQPLHNVEAFAKAFPNGDAGGNGIHIDSVEVPSGKYGSTLHHFWDAMGLSYKSIPTPESLISRFPYESVESEVTHSNWGNNFNKIQDDSYGIAKDAYSEIDWETYDGKPTTIVQLSSAYVKFTQDTCARLITIAGYRLANLLEYIAKVLPDPSTLSATRASCSNH